MMNNEGFTWIEMSCHIVTTHMVIAWTSEKFTNTKAHIKLYTLLGHQPRISQSVTSIPH